MKIIALLIVCAAVAGCASASHERVLADGSHEKTSINTFLSTTAIKGFSESTKDGTGTNSYSRTVRVADSSTQTEIEKLAPLIESIAKGAAEGAAKGIKP